MAPARAARSNTRASWRVPTIPASSTTSTLRPGSPPSRRAEASSRSMVDASMPAAVRSSAAARAARAHPMTRWPADSQAARAASRAAVLPVPAAPTMTSTPRPLRVTADTSPRCSALRCGRRRRAKSTRARGTRATSSATRAWASASTRASMARTSGVVKRALSASRGPTLPSRRRSTCPVRSATDRATTWPEARKASVTSSTVSTSPPCPKASATACTTAR